MLTSLSRDATSLEEFSQVYQSVMEEAALGEPEYEIRSALVDSDRAQVSYQVKLNSVLVGEITRDTVMNLSMEGGQWRVQWDYTLILPELQGGNYLRLDRQGFVPSRANIYDNQGDALSSADRRDPQLGCIPTRLIRHVKKSSCLFYPN